MIKKLKFKAFTLIELLISLSILSVIAFLSFSSFVSIRKVVDLNRENENTLRDIRWFLNRLDSELSGSIYVRRDKKTGFQSQRKEIGEKKVNNLIFTTIVPQRYLEIGKRGEIIKIEYDITQNEKDEELLVLTKKTFYNTFSLYDNKENSEVTIRYDFTSFSLRFYRNGKWYDSWDTKKMDLLPEKIELTFSIFGIKYQEFFNVFISETWF